MTDATGSSSTAPPIAPERRLFARLRDRIVASDPAFSRLRLALRALLSTLINVGILGGFTFVIRPLPLAAYGIAMILSFMGAMAVRDKTPGQRTITRILAAVASVAVMLLASLLAVKPAVAYVAFIVVIFGAVYVRQYGQRGFFIGMVSFMAYFMGDYLHPKPGDIGWVALAAVIALAVTHFVTQVLLTDDPERDFRRAGTTIDRRINLILRTLREAAHHGGLDKTGRKELNRHLARLRDIILMAEGFIPQGSDGALTGTGPASDLAVALFDLQLAVERLVAASNRVLPPARLTQAVLYFDEPFIVRASIRLKDAPEGNRAATQQVLIRVHRARQRLSAMLVERPMRAFLADAEEAPDAGTPENKDEGDRTSRIPEIYHLPIQVSLASGIAMGSGLLISSTRWYWAVITAFIVFNNTRSRADTAIRALNRSAGTLAGIVAGTIVATVIHGAMAPSLVGLVLCFFLGFYFVQTSYGVMIFFITIALALLYGLMGVFTPELLLLRLEETLVGAACGVFCAFFVFPKRATTGVVSSFDSFLSCLDELVSAARTCAHGGGKEIDILALSRSFDRKLADLSAAARPLGGPWSVVTRYGEVREKLLLLTGCAHWARVLARGLSRGKGVEAEQLERFDQLADEVSRQIERARQEKQQFFLAARSDKDVAMPREPRRSLAVREDESPLLALEVISALMERAIAGAWRGNP